MIRYFLSQDGEILRAIMGNREQFQVNTKDGEIFIDTREAVVSSSYYSFTEKRFIALSDAPSPQHVFDYEIKQWIDPRALEEIKAQKWAEIKSRRDQLEFGGFEFEGNIYDSDQVSQGRIMGAAISGVDQVWTPANNTTVELNASQLQQLYAALQAHIASVHERGRIARQLILEAETKEKVEAIQLFSYSAFKCFLRLRAIKSP